MSIVIHKQGTSSYRLEERLHTNFEELSKPKIFLII